MPNTSFQRTRVRGGRGPGPLNSNRWRGASRRPNGTGVNCTPGGRRGAGQPVVQADGRMLASHASARKRAPATKRRSLTPVPLGSDSRRQGNSNQEE